MSENPVFVGLISLVTGSTLQDDIAATARQLLRRGLNILGTGSPGTGERQDPIV
jgi:Flp pilus assembly CpaF family ATPase